jgi:hypothetical protein
LQIGNVSKQVLLNDSSLELERPSGMKSKICLLNKSFLTSTVPCRRFREITTRLFVTLSLSLISLSGCAGSQTGRAPVTAPSELALIEIFSWGASKCEPTDEYHTGFLIAKTVESTGDKLPSEFKIRFRRKLLGGPGSTVWNRLPSRSGGELKILNGEWLIGYFRKDGDMWVARPNGELVELARPEDLSNEQLRILQAKFETPFIRVWFPEKDILEDIMSRIKWRMSVAELREAFEGCELSEDKWQLGRSAFRNKLYLAYPNTRVVFEFSGVVDTAKEGRVPVTSSLVAFSIEHPMKERPDTGSRRPPQSVHYQYIKKLHDRYLARLEKNDVDYEHEEMFHSGTGYGYMFWEKCSSKTDGPVTFVYWTIPGHTGVLARAPTNLIAEDLKREGDAARIKTQNWPIGVCGSQ